MNLLLCKGEKKQCNMISSCLRPARCIDPVGSHFSSLPISPSLAEVHLAEKPDVRFAKVRKNNAQFSISEKTQLKK
jgi:hypothetical protein